jgi:hypothetical protein
MHTEFRAIVDGTTGDTYLRPVKANILHTSLLASGFVVRISQPEGHWIKLDVSIGAGKIEDLLKLGVRTNPPVMIGNTRLNTRFDLPPGEANLSDRLKLAGRFEATDARFTNDTLQRKIGALSLRNQGKPKLAKGPTSDDVLANIGGKFGLRSGVLSFSVADGNVKSGELHFALETV